MDALEKSGIIASKTATYGGAAGAVFAGFSVSEIGIIVGAVVGVAGLVGSQYWSRRKTLREDFIAKANEARAQAEHKARMLEHEARVEALKAVARKAEPEGVLNDRCETADTQGVC